MALQNVAFYAPLKSPNHPVPSGDRAMAQGLMAALQEMSCAPQVDLVSELRSRDGAGDRQVQQEILIAAEMEFERILENAVSKDWQVWVTYHNYYKAPDLLGPKIAATLNIPYVLIEASRSPKRLQGLWAGFAMRAEAACDAADSIFYMTNRDRPALVDGQPEGQNLLNLPPFLNQTALPKMVEKSIAPKVLLAVGMLRSGDKLASYQKLADMLPSVKETWVLHVVGDGPAAAQIRALFAPFGTRVKFLGQLLPSQVATEMAQADVFVWPGVKEAFGMVYLEAQAHGLPIVAQNRPGVRDVIGDGGTLVAVDDLQGFAAAIDGYLRNGDQRELAQVAARRYIKGRHLRPAASVRLERELLRLLGKDK